MLICNPYEVVIHGTTSSGKIFRPGDWAERLCGILSSFTKDNRLSYSKWVRPMLVDNIRCVAVDKKLETDNPQMFRFLMDFAADNDLRVIDCKALLEEREQGGQNDPANERVLLAQAIEEKHAAEKTQEQTASGASYVLREIGADDTATSPNIRNTPISKTCRRRTERLSRNTTANPKQTTAAIPPLATICKLLNAISGVTANTPSESGTARCKSNPCNTFNTKP